MLLMQMPTGSRHSSTMRAMHVQHSIAAADSINPAVAISHPEKVREDIVAAEVAVEEKAVNQAV